MKNTSLSIFLMGISSLLFGQKVNFSQDWLNQLENPKYESNVLKTENLIDKYKSYDFSSIIFPKQEFLGFIGSDYQRIYIRFSSVKKDSDPIVYRITGSSLVKTNKFDFEGIIKIKQIREFKSLHFGVDNMYKDKGIKAQGVLIGDYLIKEHKDQKQSGEFSGVMTLYWYIDKNGKLLYDDIRKYSDEYRNNQYVGIWRSLSNGKEKTCNWGEYRIPFSGDLDIGAGEFSPNKKYSDKGWNSQNK
jgi:hypothetical protein